MPLAFSASIPTLGLLVNSSSGATFMINNSANAIIFRGYEVTSARGSLDVSTTGWTSFADQGISVAGADAGQHWEEGGSPSSNGLFEGFLLGSTNLEPSALLSLGRAYNTTVNARDLVFIYRLASVPGVVNGSVQYVTAQPPISGDYDDDKVIGGSDFLCWQRALGANTSLPNDATPGSVSAADLMLWKSNLGFSYSTPASGAVPEPVAAMLAILGSIVLAFLCNRRQTVLLILLALPIGLSDSSTQFARAQSPPASFGILPSSRQLDWQALEFYAFVHFGPNTYTDEEWGRSQSLPDVFNPTNSDTDQWAKSIADAGMKGMILTVKHHDGMTLWDSATTTYKIENSQWAQQRNAQGLDTNVMRMAAESCRKYGIKFGIYLSPWDLNRDPQFPKPQLAGTIYDLPQIYGDDTPGDYNDLYAAQLTEACTMTYNDGTPIDLFEIWLDGAHFSDTFQTYDSGRFRDIIHQYQPNAVLWGHGGEARWSGTDNEIGDVNWHRSNSPIGNGDRYGNQWLPAEPSANLRAGFFYHSYETPKSVPALMDIYLKTVGRSVDLLFSVAPNRAGGIEQVDIDRMQEFKHARDEVLLDDLLSSQSPITASAVRGGNQALFGPQKVLDCQPDTYWTMNDGQTTGSFEISLGGMRDVDGFVVQEYIALGQRIGGYAIDAFVNGAYQTVVDGVSLGYQRIGLLDAPITTDKIRFRVTQSDATPIISNFRVLGDVSTSLAGDLDLNGVVNVADWKLFLQGAGVSFSGMSSLNAFKLGDLNRDRKNDIKDFDLFMTTFEARNGQGAIAAMIAVAEPSGIILILVTSLLGAGPLRAARTRSSQV
jgi:alpha-L-fucosidase